MMMILMITHTFIYVDLDDNHGPSCKTFLLNYEHNGGSSSSITNSQRWIDRKRHLHPGPCKRYGNLGHAKDTAIVDGHAKDTELLFGKRCGAWHSKIDERRRTHILHACISFFAFSFILDYRLLLLTQPAIGSSPLIILRNAKE